MPTVKSLNALEKLGIDLNTGDSKRYNHFDTLASKKDLADLFETLSKFRDKNHRGAAFTAVSVVANPDFQKIRDNNFGVYYPEPFTKTLERYFGSDSPYPLWKEGIKEKIFVPQFHAREHLNIGEWMRALQSGNREALWAFDEGMWGFNNKKIQDSSISFQAAFDLYYPGDLELQASTISEGLILFEQLFGYKATFFVPPNGPFNNTLEKVAAEGGIKYMSASKVQMEPQGYDVSKKVYHWLGQENKHDQLYLTRNCFFEPSQGGKDWVSSCLSDIEIAFRWHKPAVISSHRVNYIGSLHPENRESGLRQLSQLLTAVLKTWPDVVFQTSDELGDLIATSKKKR
jgi:hypothetical protein